MKKNKFIFLLPLLLASIVACGNVSSVTPSTGNTPSTVNPTTTMPGTTTTPTTTPDSIVPPEVDRGEAYAYEPHLTEKMPKISVKTTDGSNEFATKYNRNDKLAGLIDYVDCTITTSNCEDDYLLQDVACEIKVRGNYTLEYEKKPLRLKFNKKQKMFGLNNDAKAKSWVLLADWKDRSMMNNATTFFLGNTILGSDGFYSSDYRYVEVELNGQYWGVYLLVEQQQLNEYRVDLPEPEDDYEGTDIGYLLEYDGYYNLEDPNNGGDYTFTMNYNNNAPVQKYGETTYTNLGNKGYTIKSDITSTKQVDFIKKFMDAAYRIIYEAAYNDKAYVFNDTFTSVILSSSITPREAIERVLDTQSLVDMYIISEIACDADIAWSSFYMDVSFEKDNFKRITFEAPWDFDSAYGIKNGVVNNSQGLYAATSNNVWLTILINEPWFQDMIKEKWAELIKYEVFDKALQHNADATALYKPQFEAEMTRWPGKKHNGELTGLVNSFTTQEQAANYAYTWTQNRITYINTVWGDGKDLTNDFEEIDGYNYYRYEAEKAALNGPVAKDGTQYNCSGGRYLGNVNGSKQNTIEFSVNSTGDQVVHFFMGISKRNASLNVSDVFTFKVNGVDVVFNVKPIQYSYGDGWHDWYSQYMGEITLKNGANKLLVTTTGNGETTNFDYIDLYAAKALS